MRASPPPPPPASSAQVEAYTRQSRTYEPGDPELRTKVIRRFRLRELEQIPAEHRDVHRALMKLMPEALFDAGFVAELRGLLLKYTEIETDLWLHSVRVMNRTALRSLIPGHTCMAVVGLAPLNEKVLIEFDLRFVYRCIDRMLGSHGLTVDVQRPLTELEQGVFSYLGLKALRIVQGQLHDPEQVALRLEDLRPDLKSCADLLRHEDHWMVASFKMNFDLDVSYVRALIPVGLARRAPRGRAPAGSVLSQRQTERIRSRMGRLAGVVTEGRVEAGRIELTPNDVRALDPGDIILPDECHVQLEQGEVTGGAFMYVGRGKAAVLHGAVGGVGDGPRRLVFEVTHIEELQMPEEHDPVEVHGEPKHPEDAMAEYEEPAADFPPGEGEIDEGAQGPSDPDDVLDEDWGIDDENNEEDYEEGDEGYSEEVAVDDEDNLPDAEPLLGDIPISVVIELGRVQLSADEVIRLRPGQLLELGRSPTDPVDLVVNGRLLAKGELVEIEGSLGVKILNLLKEPQ